MESPLFEVYTFLGSSSILIIIMYVDIAGMRRVIIIKILHITFEYLHCHVDIVQMGIP